MARRRFRKRKYKNSSEIDFVGGLLGLVVIGAFIQSVSFNDAVLSVDYAKLFWWVFLGGGALVLLYAIVLMIRNGIVGFVQKLARGQLFAGSHDIEELLTMDPRIFEHYVAGMFEHQGYEVEAVTQLSADNGIDVIVKKSGKRFAVQTKRYSGRNYVKAKEVRDFYGSYSYKGDAFDGGFFVTTSYFGKQARSWAEERNMQLVDRPALSTMVRGYDFQE